MSPLLICAVELGLHLFPLLLVLEHAAAHCLDAIREKRSRQGSPWLSQSAVSQSYEAPLWPEDDPLRGAKAAAAAATWLLGSKACWPWAPAAQVSTGAC